MHQRHGNAHGQGHLAILGGGTNPQPETPAVHEQPQPADDGERKHGNQKTVDGKLQVEDCHVAREGGPDPAHGRSPDPDGGRLQDQADAEGCQDGGERVAADERTQRASLHDQPEDENA